MKQLKPLPLLKSIKASPPRDQGEEQEEEGPTQECKFWLYEEIITYA